MGRRGRPPKVKAVSRAPSEVRSSSSSSSPKRYLFHDSASHEKAVAHTVESSTSAPKLGLSWAFVLKGSSSQIGISSNPPIVPVVSDCRVGLPKASKPHLEVDEHGFRPLKKTYRPKAQAIPAVDKEPGIEQPSPIRFPAKAQQLIISGQQTSALPSNDATQ
ncbi:unnamed protein product [Amaranthus hypochondriacus]